MGRRQGGKLVGKGLSGAFPGVVMLPTCRCMELASGSLPPSVKPVTGRIKSGSGFTKGQTMAGLAEKEPTQVVLVPEKAARGSNLAALPEVQARLSKEG